MKTIQKLPKLPVFRSEREHKYFCEKSNKWLKYSTTQVCNELDEKAIAGGWKDIYEIKESKFTEEPKNNHPASRVFTAKGGFE